MDILKKIRKRPQPNSTVNRCYYAHRRTQIHSFQLALPDAATM